MAEVFFLPDGKATLVEAGMTLRHAAERAGVHISSICGGDGTCGKCRVIIRQGEVQAEPTAFLSQSELTQGYALACQSRVFGDLIVEVPLESQWEGRALLGSLDAIRFGQILPCHPDAQPYRDDPLSRKVFLTLPQPTLADHLSDWERLQLALQKALGNSNREARDPDPGFAPAVPVSLDLPTLHKLPRLLRENEWQITATVGSLGTSRCRYFNVLDLEPGDTSGHNFGIAVDIGTTTVVAHLIDLATGHTLSQQGRYNSQIRYGEDVISRIIYTTEEEDGLGKLQASIVRDINQLISELCTAPLTRSDIRYLVCAGNPTMVHFLLGLEAAQIRREPYIPVVQCPPVVRAAEVGIQLHENGLLRCLPGVGAYVGADITAGILASGLHQSSELVLYFDIGTNGEVVLGNKDWLICCSASAGPAFEGGEMKSGMRAAAGAIERVALGPDGQVSYQVIGGGKPRGLCGSGLIDCVAELVRWDYIDRAGRFHPERSRGQLREGDFEWDFLLVPAANSDTGQDVVITQSDIDVFLRSKGAVYTAAESLLAHMGLAFTDVARVYIAGGFGNYLDLRNSIAIGLIPDLPLEKFHFLGNASLAGAKMGLMSIEALEEVDQIAAKMTYFDLSTDPKFMNEFVSSLFLPHTDLEKFPSVSGKENGSD